MSDMQEAIPVEEQSRLRREKLAQKRSVANAYPNDFKRKDFFGDLAKTHHDDTAEQLEASHPSVIVAGRLMTRRVMGKAMFMDLQDMTGRMQIYLRSNDLPEGMFEETKHWDLGDIIGVVGAVFRTKTGELSIKAITVKHLVKALHPLPDKFHGLSDLDLCYRQRYLDLIMNAETRNRFKIRSQVVQYIRNYLTEARFLEVETPMMHPIPGGASAKPFVTHHNALGKELFLRIAPELYLKRLVVGGMERVFEINRNFRNEGLSPRHNPEFTMLEFYCAYWNYHDLITFTENMLQGLAKAVLGTATFSYQGKEVSFAKPFAKLTMEETILRAHPDLNKNTVRDVEALKKYAEVLKLKVEGRDTVGALQVLIFEETVEPTLIQPTFVTAYPIEVSPLARCTEDAPHLTDRFELFIMGREIANGFSELNDPEDQAARFSEQVARLDKGDEEAMHFDEDYITALEYGLPPTAGEGIGIDRLVMLLTDAPAIRDVILFPQLR